MKKIKLFSFVLTFVMLLALFPMTASADIGDNSMSEYEPNNKINLADVIYDDYTVSGSLSQYDLDYYEFDVYETSEINVLSIDKYGAAVFGVYDSYDNLIAISEFTYYDSRTYSVLESVSLTPGTYYLLFLNADENYYDNTYTFYFTCTPTYDYSYGWFEDSKGWYYIDVNGNLITNDWVLDSVGWSYVGADGYMITNAWLRDSVGWCYVGDDGYCVTDSWMRDSYGWCYLDSNGRMATNQWIKDSAGWCYVGADGYCITNSWMKDSVGWCYLDANGRMVYNAWVQDSIGWCYVGADGYMVYDQYVKDSNGWCYIGLDGYWVA